MFPEMFKELFYFNSLRGGVAFGTDRNRKPSKGSGGSRRRKGSVPRKHSSWGGNLSRSRGCLPFGRSLLPWVVNWSLGLWRKGEETWNGKTTLEERNVWEKSSEDDDATCLWTERDESVFGDNSLRLKELISLLKCHVQTWQYLL